MLRSRRFFLKKFCTLGISLITLSILKSCKSTINSKNKNPEQLSKNNLNKYTYTLKKTKEIDNYNQPIFIVPISALKMNDSRTKALVVKQISKNGEERFITVTVIVNNIDNGFAKISLNNLSKQTSYIEDGDIIIDDFVNYLKTYNNLNHEELKEKFENMRYINNG